MSPTAWSAFRPDVRGRYLDRPNRFVVRAEVEGRTVEAHCPNPGRMTELLFPGCPLILERAPEGRKLPFTLVAVQRPGAGGSLVTIPLASVRSNGAVGALVLPLLFPGARNLRPEFTLEGSRFDWLAEDAGGARHLVEVKACSEVEYGTALFPDAPSDRGRRHLEELAASGDRGYVPHVVFAVVHGRPATFGPNRHTDPAFSRTLARLAPRLRIHAVLFETGPDGLTRVVDPALEVDLTGTEAPDAGLLVTLEPGQRWRAVVTHHPRDWARAVSRVPARRSFAIREAEDRSGDLVSDLARAGGLRGDGGTLTYPSDPRQDPRFVDTVMRWRHRRVGGP